MKPYLIGCPGKVACVDADPLIAAIVEAVDRTPNAVVLRVHLAQLFFDRCRYAEALMQCGAALLSDPSDAAALQLLQRCVVALTAHARWTEPKPAAGEAPPHWPANGIDQRHRQGRHWAPAPAKTNGHATPANHRHGDKPNGIGSPAKPIAPRGPVLGALSDFADSGSSDVRQASPSFTTTPEADELLLEDPFAFLLGVLFDQGIPAERAWRAPYDLRARLGHLNPCRMADDPEAVRRAIGMSPRLHRFVENMSSWVVSAALLVRDDYRGDASAIWRGHPAAADVQSRLQQFPGIGQQKAAMAVQILRRDCGVPIIDVPGPEIAYGVPARRVMLRTGLAQVDELDHMLAVIRNADPSRSTDIGCAAWTIGKIWCRAGIPWCETCPLTHVCPKHIVDTVDATVP